MADVPGAEVSAAASLWPGGWLGGALAWLPVVLVEMISIPNERLLVLRFHDMRHTCVTLLLDLNAPPHIEQAIVGHSGMEVTMAIYAHASREEQRRALQGLSDRLG